MHFHFPRAEAKQGFTLVELLVVIGIVAVLVAMLLPALQRVREQARLLECLTRIRQVAMVAIGMYTADNRGDMLPLVGVSAGFPVPSDPFNANGHGVLNQNLYITQPNSAPWNAMWPDYVQRYVAPQNQRDNSNFTGEFSPILYCAADDIYGDSGKVGWWGHVHLREFSWRMNWDVTPTYDESTTATIIRFRKIGGVRNSTKKVLLAESHYERAFGAQWCSLSAEGIGYGFGSGILSPTYVPRWGVWLSPPRHRTGLVAAYCDGHAEVIPFDMLVHFREGAPYGGWSLSYNPSSPNPLGNIWNLDIP